LFVFNHESGTNVTARCKARD